MSKPTEQGERERLIEQAARTVGLPDGTATRDIEDLINAGWRPPPSRDVILETSRVLEEVCHQKPMNAVWQSRELAKAGLLRTLVQQDPTPSDLQAAPRLGATESVSIPVPPPDELVERVMRALARVEYDQRVEALTDDEFEEYWTALRANAYLRMEYRDRARAALRAAGEGQQ